MKTFYSFSYKNKKDNNNLKKFLLLLFVVSSIFFTNVNKASAVFPVFDAPKKIWDTVKDILKKGGSLAYQRTLSSILDKVAYDTANYLGSGGKGQKPLFITESFSDYAKQMADEAAGTFLESLNNTLNSSSDCEAKYEKCLLICEDPDNKNTQEDMGEMIKCRETCHTNNKACDKAGASTKSQGETKFNICQPSSIEAKLQISLGLAQQRRPQAPNCTASEMINNWGDSVENKIALFESGEYLKNVSKYFDPTNNDLGILLRVNSDFQKTAEEKEKTTFDETLAKGGWLDVRNIAGKSIGVPGSAERALRDADNLKANNFGKITGDVFVDAANLFLNQLALSAYKNVINNLGNLSSNRSSASDSLLINPEADPNLGIGSSLVKERTMKILEVNSSTDREVNILAELSSCIKADNPSPNSCVIDGRFMQAIIDRKTVAEAIESGQLSSNWKIEKEVFPSAYKSHFSLRNIKILRKHRILPVAWELAVERAFADPSKPRNATLQDLISCFDPIDEFDSFSDGFDASDVLWCEGLVDPNWVLKAPLSYCGQKGSGSYVYETVYSRENIQYNIPEEFTLFRSEDYCADNQTCIKESKDGGCDAFGYCVEERRTWKFEEDSCSPINNTCQTFISSANNESVSYLENTIDYGECNIDSAGCRRYSMSGSYNDNGSISWNFSNNIYFNNNLGSCSQVNDGCSQLIRVKPTWGANLLVDADFESGPLYEEVGAGMNIASFEVISSSQSSQVELIDEDLSRPGVITKRTLSAYGVGSVGIKSSVESFPKDLQILNKQNYTLSADVFLLAGDRLEVQLNPGDRQSVEVVNETNEWQRISVTSNSSVGFSSPNFSFIAYAANSSTDVGFYIKNIKFELGDWGTSYASYGNKKINQKLLPGYLEQVCYVDASSATKDYSLSSEAPSVCYNYARKCNYNEVGCNLFTSKNDNFSIPAKTFSSDYCPGECLGYDVYVSKENYFNSVEAKNLIPTKAKTCSQEAVGCNEFTNLDQVAKGAEGREYYSRLKQCIKPDSSRCLEFYTWEASSSGTEITAYSLQRDSNGNPLTTFKDQADGDCSAIYNLPVGDPEYNPDCREFRNSSGQISHRLASHLITCSDNCFSYRLSEKNIDSTIKTASECSGTDKHWNSSSSVCYSCLNGGLWSNDQGACVYNAIPNEGKKCKAADLSCREYNGSQGSNIKLLSSFSFDRGLEGWTAKNQNTVSLAAVSNNQNGQSLKYTASGNDAARVEIRSSLEKSSSYTLRFLARSKDANNLEIYFSNEDDSEKYSFNSREDVYLDSSIFVSGGNEWNIYNVNLTDLPESITAGGTLNITASKDFYLDNLTLTKVNNRYYLLRDSLQIPDICYYDNLGEYQGEDYNLGCYQYQDQNNLIHNLHNFSDICSNSSVGCEQMIHTNNYNSPNSEIWKDKNENGVCDSDEGSCVMVERDSAIYAIYDKGKNCLEEDIGCVRMGEGVGYGGQVSWSDVFKLNNPNNYSRSLCLEEDLGCEEYKDTQGSLNYFRNPASNTCVYRKSQDPDIKGKQWFKSAVKRCDTNGNKRIDGEERDSPICKNDDDCSFSSCITDDNDYFCSVDYLKTIGYGGVNSSVPVPEGSVGLCDQAESGCTEYIDPVSYFNPNLVKNSNFAENGKFWGVDTWPGEQSSRVASNEQVVSFSRNKLHSFKKVDVGSKSLSTTASTATITFVNPVRVLRSNNTFSEPVYSISLNKIPFDSYVIFNSLENYSALVRGGEVNMQLELKEVAISYNLKNNDGSDCSGVVDTDQGCVLFNERSVNGGSGLKGNYFNAYSTANSKNPVTNKGPFTANELVKVRPDRNCATWLSCTSYVIDNDKKLCTSMAECNLLGDNNECVNYIMRSPQESYTFDPEKNKNASGYSIPGNYYFNNIKEVGLNTRARYNFEEAIPSLSCLTTSVGGVIERNSTCVFDNNIAKDNLIKSPLNAPVKYPAEGSTYLKVSPFQAISPQSAESYIVLSDLSEAGKYYISYLVNTKNSNTKAVVTIWDHDKKREIVSFKSSSPVDWKREVKSFEVSGQTNVRIYLSLENSKGTGSVYFDDINIESVLKIGDDKYAARDCRLYPTSSSFSCKEVDNTIVRNGLEGYCLEYDLANPSVCQLWMPLERISSARISSNQLGYDGKYPLNYCAEVDTNFIFLEKRVTTLIKEEKKKSFWNKTDQTCYYPGKALSFCTNVFGSTEYDYEINVEENATSTTSTSVSQTTGKASTTTGDSTTDGSSVTVTPIIKATSTKVIIGSDDKQNSSLVASYCGTSGNYFLLEHIERTKNRKWWLDDFMYRYVCVPINNSTYYSNPDGAPSRTLRHVASDFQENNLISIFDKVKTISDGWYLADGFDNTPAVINELTNDKEPIRVLDLNHSTPSNEEDLKKISSSNPDEVFRLTCNKFVETVSANGDNMAFVERVNRGSDYKITTANGITYNGYERKLDDLPFGAAAWPKDFDLMKSDRVPLANQYSRKEKEDIFAGRPYGCDASSRYKYDNCAIIGYCSANPDVYCLTDRGFGKGFNMAKKSCGSWGVCMPLWTLGTYPSGALVSNYIAPLSQIFLQAPTAYRFKESEGGYKSDEGYYKTSNVGSNPSVSDIKLYSSVSEVSKGSTMKPGTYRLDFYANVDAERQPLREIFINWGDGSRQILSGYDARGSGTGFPHSFYHYYSNSITSPNISVQVFDNWGRYSSETFLR